MIFFEYKAGNDFLQSNIDEMLLHSNFLYVIIAMS